MNKFLATVAFALLIAGSAAHADGSGRVPKPVEQTGKPAVVNGGSACVDANGSWVNWPWPNVPTLSPPCPTAPEPTKSK